MYAVGDNVLNIILKEILKFEKVLNQINKDYSLKKYQYVGKMGKIESILYLSGV